KVSAQIAKRRMAELRYPSEMINSVTKIVDEHMRLKSAGPDGSRLTDKAIRKFVITMGDELEPALKMMHSDNIAHSVRGAMPDQIPAIKKRIETLKMGSSPKVTLPIDGRDVMQVMGIKPGPDVKRALNR